MGKEFKDLIKLNPVLLFKDDLFELEKLLVEDSAENKLEIEVAHEDTTISAQSFSELFSKANLPHRIDGIKISMMIVNKFTPEKSITISMRHNSANIYIHSNEKTWFFGKKTNLLSFFKKNKPWYSLIQVISPYVCGVTLTLLTTSIEKLIRTHECFMLFPILTCILVIIAMILAFKQILFPYVKIVLKEKRKINLEIKEILAIVAYLITIIQLIIGLVK